MHIPELRQSISAYHLCLPEGLKGDMEREMEGEKEGEKEGEIESGMERERRQREREREREREERQSGNEHETGRDKSFSPHMLHVF